MAFFGDFGRTFNLETPEVFRTIGATLLGGPQAGIAEGIKSVATPIPTSGGTQQGQSVAVSRATQTRPQETQASGTLERANVIPQAGTYFPSQPAMQAGFGLAGPLVSAGRKLLPDLFGGLLGGAAVGAVAPIVMDSFGEPKKLRVTRKMQRTLKQVVDQFGLAGAMELTGLDQNTIMFIYTKKFRNDGPYVTKAAVRKTRQTVRKMKNLCDMYDDLRPAAKRRAPVRRTGMTKITQVK
jgi:hypothetical protein